MKALRLTAAMTVILCLLCGCSSFAFFGSVPVPDQTETLTAPVTERIETRAAETLPTETAPVETAPAETTQPVSGDSTQQTPRYDNLIDGFDSSQRRTLNIFLSNFSEAFFGSFDRNSFDPYAVLSFCHIHFVINNSEYLDYGPEEMTMSAENADACLNRYLGISLPHGGRHESSYGTYYRYEDGYWITGTAMGESYNNFTIANDLRRNPDGTYTVHFDVYGLDLETYFMYDMPDELYSLRRADDCSYKIEYLYSGTAIIEDYTLSTGSASYRLIKYDTPY